MRCVKKANRVAIFYLETSALAKHCRHEKGSDVVDFIFGRKSPKDRLVISFLSIIEFTGLITRLQKSRTITKAESTGIISRFEEDCLSIDITPITISILEIALGIAKQYGLRSLDSLHLSTMVNLK